MRIAVCEISKIVRTHTHTCASVWVASDVRHRIIMRLLFVPGCEVSIHDRREA